MAQQGKLVDGCQHMQVLDTWVHSRRAEQGVVGWNHGCCSKVLYYKSADMSPAELCLDAVSFRQFEMLNSLGFAGVISADQHWALLCAVMVIKTGVAISTQPNTQCNKHKCQHNNNKSNTFIIQYIPSTIMHIYFRLTSLCFAGVLVNGSQLGLDECSEVLPEPLVAGCQGAGQRVGYGLAGYLPYPFCGGSQHWECQDVLAFTGQLNQHLKYGVQ